MNEPFPGPEWLGCTTELVGEVVNSAKAAFWWNKHNRPKAVYLAATMWQQVNNRSCGSRMPSPFPSVTCDVVNASRWKLVPEYSPLRTTP
jgi:hypothetical protein